MNNSIHSLEYYKTEIEVKEKDYMKYKVGDKVKIREDLVPFRIYDGITMVRGMLASKGKVITICGYGCGRNAYEMDNGYFYSSEMFDQNWKEDKFMKTSEFKNELGKLGYTFEGKFVMNENNVTIAWVSTLVVNKIDTNYGPEFSPKAFSLIYKYAATPIAERNDEKLFNIQIIKGRWGRASWLYRDYDVVNTSSPADNNDLNQRWTLAQIEEYGIDDETIYKRVPVEEE